ncbi:hypothetical protein H6F96_14095 [Microcoleus sp. FACHB-53]|nr:hypothetical protein [Microcoleus sp. FACHB-53]MBD2125067.1 hypothetical protein [Microcoleus sp. FACHB-1]
MGAAYSVSFKSMEVYRLNTVSKAEPVKQDSLLTWFRWLKRWVRQIFTKGRTKQRPLKVIERTESHDEQTSLVFVERDAPGAVGTWYMFRRDNPRVNLLITLDNLAAIRLALRHYRPQGMEMSNFERSLIHQDPIFRTHRISIQWIVKLRSSRTVFNLIGTWDADLQGDSFDPNSKAITIFRLVGREALNLPPIPGVQWRARMANFPWTDSMESYARAVFGEYHKSHIKKILTNPMPVSK